MPRFRSFAKVNLRLAVLGRRDDGFHDVETVLQTIDWHDELDVDLVDGEGVRFELTGGDAPGDDSNLVVRAARAFLERRPLPAGRGLRLRLDKRLPAGAGLGGGSANAATTLLALECVLGGLPPSELHELAAALGSDVPFFLLGGAALATGRGETLTPLGDLSDETGLLLVLPPWGLSTADVYGAWREGAEHPAEAAAFDPARDWPPPGGWTAACDRNDLEEPAFRLRPELARVYTSLVRARVGRVRMSGSGSTLFVAPTDPDGERRAIRSIPPEYRARAVRTLSRAAWQRLGGVAATRNEGE